MPRKPAATGDNTAAIAGQFGISLKALRLYERLGMLNAPRTKAGWRVYGRAEIERLHAILSLKQLGLPLARIVELLRSDVTDLGALLSVQESVLRESQRETEHALRLIRIAKVHVRKNGHLTGEELAALVRSISKSVFRFTPELEELARGVFTPSQLKKFQVPDSDAEHAARVAMEWGHIRSDIEAMLPDGDPLSRKGLALARRAVALIKETTGDDRDLWNNAYRFWKEAISDPRTVDQMEMKQAHWDFMAKAMTELKRRGELAIPSSKEA